MALKQPESMEELVYFTNRTIGDGRAKVWVFCKDCPKCGNMMKKPIDPKTGKFKTRADTYVCVACGHTEAKADVEPTLTACASYTCPECKKEGEAEFPFKRKTYKGVKALVFDCEHCGASIPITKKMKEIKKK